jgi:hypothetical protein
VLRVCQYPGLTVRLYKYTHPLYNGPADSAEFRTLRERREEELYGE